MASRFIFIGAPGVGKGTFAKLICKKHGWSHFSVGDKLRAEIATGSALGSKIEHVVKSGKLVPDEVVCEVVVQHLQKCDQTGQGFLLDGFPRTLSQAQFLSSIYKEHPIVAVNIMLDRSVTIQKLLGRRLCTACGGSFNTAHIVDDQFDMPAILPKGEDCIKARNSSENCPLVNRDDDTPEIIATRLEDFQANIDPLLDFYRKNNMLLDFQVRKGVKDTDQLFDQMQSFRCS